VDKSDLPTITKYTYLHSLLTGEAKCVLQGLSITETNYGQACKLLVERYNRKDRIISAQIVCEFPDVLPDGSTNYTVKTQFPTQVMHDTISNKKHP
jgi:hypothetical protein